MWVMAHWKRVFHLGSPTPSLFLVKWKKCMFWIFICGEREMSHCFFKHLQCWIWVNLDMGRKKVGSLFLQMPSENMTSNLLTLCSFQEQTCMNSKLLLLKKAILHYKLCRLLNFQTTLFDAKRQHRNFSYDIDKNILFAKPYLGRLCNLSSLTFLTWWAPVVSFFDNTVFLELSSQQNGWRKIKL